MKKFPWLIVSAFALAIVGQILTVHAAPYYPVQGGTGTSQIPASGTIPIGNGIGTYTPAYLLCTGNCFVSNASGSVTITVPAQTSSTIQILPVNVATSSFAIVGDGTYINVTNPGTSTIQLTLNTAQVLKLFSAASPITYNSSTGQFGCSTCITSLNGALLVANNLSDVASTTQARLNLGLGSIATFSKTDYLTSSTVYVSTVNGLSGAVTITSSTLGVVWPTVNGNQATAYQIVGTASDISSTVNGATTTLDLANVISAGNCTNCNITYDAKGRITVASNGSSGSGGIASTSPFSAPYHPLITSSGTLTNSNLSQSISTGYTTASGTFTAQYGTDGNTYTSFRIWPNPTNNPLTNFYTGTVGCQFVVSQNLTVSALGRYYNASSTNNHMAYLWNQSTGAEIASGTITTATSSDSDGFKWVNLTSTVTLFPNIPYAMSIDETASGDYWFGTPPGSGVWVNTDYFQPVIYRQGGAYGATASQPSSLNPGKQCYDAPAFKYTPNAVQQLNANYNSTTTAGVTSVSNGAAVLSGNTADDGVTIISPFPSITLQPTPGQTTNPLYVITGLFFPRINTDGAIIAGDQNLPEEAPLEVYSSRQGGPSLTSFADDLFAIRSTLSTSLAFGNNNSSPYAVWIQTRRTTQGDGTSWPLNLNPLGGPVSVNLNNVAETAQFSVGGTILSGSSGSAGCLEFYDHTTTTQLDYVYPSVASGTMVVTTTKPSFCQ